MKKQAFHKSNKHNNGSVLYFCSIVLNSFYFKHRNPKPIYYSMSQR